MSICAGVVVAIAFQQVNGSPDAEAGTEGDDEGLENADSRVEKFHICVAGIMPPETGRQIVPAFVCL